MKKKRKKKLNFPMVYHTVLVVKAQNSWAVTAVSYVEFYVWFSNKDSARILNSLKAISNFVKFLLKMATPFKHRIEQWVKYEFKFLQEYII